MLGQQTSRPRLTRLEKKHRSSRSSASSISSMALPPTYQTDLLEATHLQDLELMMQWCTSTYKTMARNPASETLWQTTVPTLSLRHPSLRQGLLALSALHLASKTSSSRRWQYLETARVHQSQALAALSSTQLDLEADPNATFTLCCLMIAFAFGYCLIDDDDNDKPDVLHEFFEVLHLTRWLVSIIMPLLDRVAAGDLNSLIQPEDPRPTMPDMSRLVVLALRRQNALETLRDPAHEEPLYESAIEHLSTALEQLMKGGEPKMFAFCWCFRVPTGFLELLEARRPFALVILAHYAVVLHHLRDSWWMGDWGAQVLSRIGDSLEPEWRALVGWPVDATGCFLSP
ncbi:hypothetical protein N7541_006018 [Penicillium brevicompactum]|uniref:Uncharacterized protein n=1 Tax=Penicillium brevicompactum TaxID=5074 RepID=A0A9W9UR35_PENBR|nr:hypothetical protein N7541_006018 [Penicillium brevicompactum]